MTEGTADSVLLDSLRSGDAAAFESLLRQHGSWMFGLARRIVGDEPEAEDAVQDACLSAFRALPTFHGQSSLSTWLHRIVVNASLMRLRSRRRRGEQTFGERAPAPVEDGHALAVTEISASSAVESEETRAAVRRAVEALPSAYRAVFVLRDVEGLSMSEVADLLDLSLSGAKSRLHRARQTLRSALEPLVAAPEPRRARL